MKITAVNAKQPSKPQFKAVNQKYFEWAKKDYSLEKNVSCDWLQRLSFDVFLFKEISPQDGIDTVNAVFISGSRNVALSVFLFISNKVFK